MENDLNQDPLNQADLVALDWVDGETTRFVGEMLIEFNRGNRVKFLCESADVSKIVARIRIKLTRVRNGLEQKRIPRQHFTVQQSIFPYTTSSGKRCSCIVLRKVKTIRHQVRESVEGIVYGKSQRHVEGSKEISRKPIEW